MLAEAQDNYSRAFTHNSIKVEKFFDLSMYRLIITEDITNISHTLKRGTYAQKLPLASIIINSYKVLLIIIGTHFY